MKISLRPSVLKIIRNQSISGVYDETNFLSEIKKANTQAKILKVTDQLEDNELEEIIKQENVQYHEKSKPRLTDLQFDVIKEQLAERKPRSKALKQVGAKVSSRAIKIKLPFPMGSLNKIKPGTKEFEAFTKNYPGPYVVSDKEDGSALQLDYRDGLKIYTRGTGIIGRDVTRIATHLNIPQKLKTPMVIRGELSMSQAAFDAKYTTVKLGEKEGYADKRSMVNSLVNVNKSNTDHMADTVFIAHSILSPRMRPSKAYILLKKLGFKVVPHKVITQITSDALSKIFQARRTKSKRGIDGMVVEQDKMHPLPKTGDNPSHSVAFKMLLDDDVKEAKVLEVVWEESKHGLLKPRVNIEPTKLGGVTIKFATGHNAFFITHGYRSKDAKKNIGTKNKPIGPDAIIKITRSGDVIPHIVEVVKPSSKPQMPQVDYKWNATNVDIVMEEKSDLTKAKKITSFFVTLGVENLKLGVVEQLQAAGLDTIKKILNADTKDFLAIEKFKETKATKLRESIDSKIKNVPLWTLMDATGIFGQGLGSRKLKPIVEMYPKILDFASLPDKQIVNHVLKVKGFSTKTATQFAKNLAKFVKYIKNLNVDWNVPKAKKPTGSSLTNKTFVFTGFRNAGMEEFITSNGGKIGTSVKSDTTALVYKPPSDPDKKPSSKVILAEKLGIPLLLEEQFQKKYMK